MDLLFVVVDIESRLTLNKTKTVCVSVCYLDRSIAQLGRSYLAIRWLPN